MSVLFAVTEMYFIILRLTKLSDYLSKEKNDQYGSIVSTQFNLVVIPKIRCPIKLAVTVAGNIKLRNIIN